MNSRDSLELVVINQEFTIKKETLYKLVDPKSTTHLESLGGVSVLTKKLLSHPDKGISTDSLEKRQIEYGTNTIPPPYRKTIFNFIWDSMKDKTLIILMVAAVASVSIGIYQSILEKSSAWLEGTVITGAILIVIAVNSINDYRKQKRFSSLEKVKNSMRLVKVYRDNEPMQISFTELHVGDILYIGIGDVVPCDGVLISGDYIKTNESSMTGESDLVEKNTIDPFFLSGTTVEDGKGKILATAVGVNSMYGKSMMSVQTNIEQTPLQVKLGNLASKIAKYGSAVAIFLMTVLVVEYFLNNSAGNFLGIFNDLTQIFIIGVTIIVVAVPEGLPLAVTLSLAYATIQMLKDNNLVRHLNACETMGNATAICSDKTGTLTMNVMTVVEGKVFENDLDKINDYVIDKNFDNFQHLVNCININSEAYEIERNGKKTFVGSKTDIALLEYTKKLGFSYVETRKNANIVSTKPFSSERKKMSCIVKNDKDETFEYVKGASEIILKKCKFYVDKNNDIVSIQNYKNEISELINTYASESLRTVCCAFRKINSDVNVNNNSIVFLGLFGIEDPVRPEATAAVKQCQKSGIVVRMVTGDNEQTAKSIAKKCGIYKEGDLVMEGPVFRDISEQERDILIPKLRVLARSSPNDKKILVEALKRLGETTAVTGDGTNDAPALKLSDVGFSMGIAGTEVAKEASDIVLMDDNFASLVKAVLWGRSVYDSIRKFIQFQLTVNISAVTIAVVTSLVSAFTTSGKPISALRAIQLLWINLIMDTVAALALSTDYPDNKLLDRKPQKKSQNIISGDMKRMIFIQAIYQIVTGLGLFFFGYLFFGNDALRINTMIFNTFVFQQIFNELNCRSISRDMNIFRGIFKNKFFLPIFFGTIVIQVGIIMFAGFIFSTTPLSFLEWTLCLVLALGTFPIGILVRLLDRLFLEN